MKCQLTTANLWYRKSFAETRYAHSLPFLVSLDSIFFTSLSDYIFSLKKKKTFICTRYQLLEYDRRELVPSVRETKWRRKRFT